MMANCPIDDVLPRLKEALATHGAAVIHAPPGAGKTTRVPLFLRELLNGEAGRIVMLEPRRIAAASAASWMARLLGEEVGDTVGYTIRFTRKVSARTRIEIVTEGILTRRLQKDPSLEGVSALIFDEFHERGIHTDLALAFALDVKRNIRADLKIIVMSATLDCAPVAALLGDAPIISSRGELFPVEERYLGEGHPAARTAKPLNERIAAAARIALDETEGDILVFLPGQREIRACVGALRPIVENVRGLPRVSLHALYGDLPFEEQERALLPSSDRKIVLATNIAETSLTIEGVRVVIDSGLSRSLRHDPSTGMNRLVTLPVSRASAEQRKGRAGRLSPGVVYRLYSRAAFRDLVSFDSPEILVSDLSSLVLDASCWNVRDFAELSWLDPPPVAAWNSASDLLADLGALDSHGRVTPEGRRMNNLPLHPRLAKLLLRAAELGAPRLGADISALLSERGIIRGGAILESNPDLRDGTDFRDRLDLLERWRRKGAPRRADVLALRAVDRIATQLLKILDESRVPEMTDSHSSALDSDLVERLLLSAYPDRIGARRAEAGFYLLANGRGSRFPSRERLFTGTSEFILALEVDAGEKADGLIHMSLPLTEAQIRSECAARLIKERRVAWDTRERRVVGAIEERLGALLLSSTGFAPSDEEAGATICEAVRADFSLLSFSLEARQFQSRVSLVRRFYQNEKWPDISDMKLAQTLEGWLLPFLSRIRRGEELSRLDLLDPLKAHLSWREKELLDKRAPRSLRVPSGGFIALDYTAGEAPLLSVKLQEMFGLAQTPTIAEGRVKVILHLLSPARRPLQVTQDLENFWNTSYHEVKKEMRGRYPKHPWPDDPWNAPATRAAKPRRK
jgi:ATP-dependent helicase HrpB